MPGRFISDNELSEMASTEREERSEYAAWIVKRLALIAALAVASPALADARLDAAFSGTIVSTYPDGRTAHLWLNRDGSYKAEGRRKKASSGTWAIKGERICLKQRKPFPGPFSHCEALPAGEQWSSKAVTGEPIKVKLVRGRKS